MQDSKNGPLEKHFRQIRYGQRWGENNELKITPWRQTEGNERRSHSFCSWAVWRVCLWRKWWQQPDTEKMRRRRDWCSRSFGCFWGRERLLCSRSGTNWSWTRYRHLKTKRGNPLIWEAVVHDAVLQCRCQCPLVSLTRTGASRPHTSSAVAPRRKPGPGSPGRWGSESEPSRAEGRRWGWTEVGATQAPPTPGSGSLKMGRRTSPSYLTTLSHFHSLIQNMFLGITCEGDDENDGNVNEEELEVSQVAENLLVVKTK